MCIDLTGDEYVCCRCRELGKYQARRHETHITSHSRKLVGLSCSEDRMQCHDRNVSHFHTILARVRQAVRRTVGWTGLLQLVQRYADAL